MTRKPEILAPAGDTQSFLAAMAAGADAVYLGLKHFSARMQADNFGSAELSRMVELANENGRRIYVAFNTLVKPDDVPAAGRLIARLARDVKPHGLIIQDPGVLALARQAGYEGGLFLSTLANLTHPASLLAAKELGADRVILPRELSIDEVKQISAACPEGLELEMFIHGALCWCVSGRCYWSSYMGGKSGLRGRCVQPCRRVYKQRNHSGRFFSCLDLSLDVLAKTITDIPHLSCWKIEGRKKGPHYVYHVVTAYKMLRDNPDDPQARKDAEKILEMALGRPSTRARFLPQRTSEPTSPDSQTSSGRLVGKIQTDAEGRPFFKPHIELISYDYLRVGYEDENWHSTLPVTRRTPKAGTFTLRLPRHKTPKAGISHRPPRARTRAAHRGVEAEAGSVQGERAHRCGVHAQNAQARASPPPSGYDAPRFAALWLRDAPQPQFGDRPVAFAQIGARGVPHCGPEHGVVAAPGHLAG